MHSAHTHTPATPGKPEVPEFRTAKWFGERRIEGKKKNRAEFYRNARSEWVRQRRPGRSGHRGKCKQTKHTRTKKDGGTKILQTCVRSVKRRPHSLPCGTPTITKGRREGQQQSSKIHGCIVLLCINPVRSFCTYSVTCIFRLHV